MQKHKFIPKANVVDREEVALELAKTKDVLHIGMGGYVDDDKFTAGFVSTDLTETLHGQLSGVAATLTGLDINPVTIKAMRECVRGDYFIDDITDPGLAERIGRTFDCILFLDVIEHLDCFRTALQNIKNLLNNNGFLVIITDNAYCLDSIIKMLFRYESVHVEHTAYFSYLTMKRLLAMNGFEIERFCYTIQHRRRAGPHRRKAGKFVSVFEMFGYYTMVIVTKILPQYAQSVLFVARPVRQVQGD